MSPKLNACQACTVRKRRCDKAQPVCTRCSENELQCNYSSRKRRTIKVHGEDLSLTQSDSDESARPLGLTTPCADPCLAGWTWGLFDGTSPPSTNPNSSQSISPASLCWFLTPGSWTISHMAIETPALGSTVYAENISGLLNWFTLWLSHGHTPFLHRQLYADGVLPQSIRDAYVSVAVHATKTSASDYIVDELLEANLSALFASQPTHEACPSTRGHLARTQALFIHLVLGLFSPSIPPRANAEIHARTLLRWTQQLWDAASTDPELCRDAASSTPSDAAFDAAFDGDPAPRLWRIWILAENVRRIWLLSALTVNTYLVIKQQWSECGGGVTFTARKALWAAESAGAWMEAVRRDDPLSDLSLRGDRFISTVGWDEVDDMGKHLFSAIWGPERIESRRTRTARTAAAKAV